MAQEPLQEYGYNANYHPENNNGRQYMTPYSPGHHSDISATPRAMDPYPLSPLSNDPRDSPYGREPPYGLPQPQSPYQQSYEYQHQQYSQQLPPVSTFMHPEEYVSNGAHTLDTTGQNQPLGMRPRLTTSLSEEEGNLCFQVDVNGICVARREDNHMINGTKLLNVVGMTRGRRDGILKAEKQKQVVKIGPMHLKGVWIPYERALALANQEEITNKLYPLFVHDIGSLLYHPSNAARPLPSPVTYQQRGGERYGEQVDDDRRPRL